MINIKKKNLNTKFDINILFAYLIGLFSTQNILYAFKISNTYINIIYVLATIIIAWKIITRDRGLIIAIRKVDKYFKYYLCTIFLSFIPYYFIIIFNNNLKYQSLFNGLISLALGLGLYICVINFSNNKIYMIKGLWHGVMLNIVISLIQLIMFNKGSYFSLYDWFPQPAFYISIPWEVAQSGALSNNEFLIYSYRAEGLFLECSYFVACMSSVVLLVLNEKRYSVVRSSCIIILSILIIISNSGNLIIYVLSLIMYLIVVSSTKKQGNIIDYSERRKFIIKILVIIPILCIITIMVNQVYNFKNILNLSSIYESIVQGISEANLFDTGNTTRLQYMLNSFGIITKYIFGTGYNMSTTVLQYEIGIVTPFNFFIKICLEQGIVGLMSYILFLINTIFILIKTKVNPQQNKILAISVICIAIFQFGNGSGFMPYVWLIFGICANEIYNIKIKRRTITEVSID